jgi:membrane-bound lytic murein transglycosylase D
MKWFFAGLAGFGLALLIMLLPPARQAVALEAPAQPAESHLSGGAQPAFPAVKLPKSLMLAGEPVPLSDLEVRERLDREMLVNTYWHSQTLQNLKLASRWFPIIEPILAQNGIPDDFKYLAVAESNLRNGVSPAGATGFWQLMETTAKEYGLTVGSEVDERYDVERATEAACRYLNNAYRRYGSWTLAAASYNMGMGGLDKRLGEQKVKSYYDLHLNTETSRYVFRVLAFKLIYEQHERYGFVLDPDDYYPPLLFRTVEVSSTLPDLYAFALAEGSNYKMLRYMNPWLRSNRLTVAPGKSYTLRLPLEG